MSSQKVKFVTGFGSFGGSSVAMLEHCAMLRENGFISYFYAPGDWHIGRYDWCLPISEFVTESDDIIVFHHFDLDMRPKCKKSLLYLHEKSLWNIEKRNLLPFDSIVYVSEDQASFHKVKGDIVPNPVGRMIDPSKHFPPSANIAGIVGTIQERKRQHVSILKALEDGRSKVLLFGDFEESYFKSKVEPLLSEKVLYMGMFDPESRMDMYSMFDCLYMHSSEECASLVLGECRLLGKEIVKSEEVKDYEILDDQSIISKWEEIFSDTSPVIGDFKALSPCECCERLVCVVTHNRKDFVGRWLRAWNNAEKFGAKIAVLHACDGEEPDSDEMNNILSYFPDFYIPFKNGPLRDMMALNIVIRDAAGLPNWESLFWFTDDMIPMRRDFLSPFVNKLNGNVGLVAQCYEPRHESCADVIGSGCLPHVRTVAYALSREASDILVFPDIGSEFERPYLFEHGRVGTYDKHILKQVRDAGYEFELCHSDKDRYVHWTGSLDWMWDCHLFGSGCEIAGKKLSSHEMWQLYESQFASPGSFDPLVILTPQMCEKIYLKKDKVSVILPTFSSPMSCFMLSVFSLLLRSNPECLDHIFVSINGPDSREGGNKLQDKKQAFVEDLRSVDWSGMRGFNPGAMTITRTWSRIGHSQALEQCLPWIDTEFYLSMHDDVLVLNDSWCDLCDFKENESMIMKTWGGCLAGRLKSTGPRLDMPHLNTIFTLCRKPMMTSLGVGWSGFSLTHRFRISDYTDPKMFESQHLKMDSLEFGSSVKDIDYESISLDIGAFMFSKIVSLGLDIGRFDLNTIKHFESASWKTKDSFVVPESEALERDIRSVPQYWEIYLRHKSHEHI